MLIDTRLLATGLMMRFRAPTVLSLILFCVRLNANQSNGQVSGRVLDQTSAALPGVAIDLLVNSRELTATTDEAGGYRFDGVPAGNAELTFRLLNFSVLRRTVAVASGASVTADAVLTLSLSADVIVTGTSTFRNVADVEDPAANLVGIAAAASQGAVSAAQLDARPVMRAGEVLETVPGLIVSQHSGEGKANQVLPTWLQPGSRDRLLDDRGRRACEHAHRCARPRLCRRELSHSRARKRGAVQEGSVLRGRR